MRARPARPPDSVQTRKSGFADQKAESRDFKIGTDCAHKSVFAPQSSREGIAREGFRLSPQTGRPQDSIIWKCASLASAAVNASWRGTHAPESSAGSSRKRPSRASAAAATSAGLRGFARRRRRRCRHGSSFKKWFDEEPREGSVWSEDGGQRDRTLSFSA